MPFATMLEVKRALAGVREVLEKGGTEADRLWQILTALRGPDSDNHAVKECTTEVVRFLALGEDAMLQVGANVSSDSPELKERRRAVLYDRGSSAEPLHFGTHIITAFKALFDLGYVDDAD